jgi:hypothetical protein
MILERTHSLGRIGANTTPRISYYLCRSRASNQEPAARLEARARAYAPIAIALMLLIV